MIVYVTRPDNHELVMGGYRHVVVWTEKPDYYHYPVRYHSTDRSNPRLRYIDRGWAFHLDRKSNAPFKPLAEQDAQLSDNAWNLLAWSACPKGVDLDGWVQWARQVVPQDDGSVQDPEFARDNWSGLLHCGRGDSNLVSNVHHRRFLMRVNLRTTECGLVVPRVHYFGDLPSEDTQTIEEPFLSRHLFACPEWDIDEGESP